VAPQCRVVRWASGVLVPLAGYVVTPRPLQFPQVLFGAEPVVQHAGAGLFRLAVIVVVCQLDIAHHGAVLVLAGDGPYVHAYMTR
jgi:hypothetical protein